MLQICTRALQRLFAENVMPMLTQTRGSLLHLLS